MKVAIVGGGLVGALSACMLGQRGYDVEVFEYRPDPRTLDPELSRGRSINLALSVRGRTSLARVGLEEAIISAGIPMKGRMLHSHSGDKKEVLYDPNGHQCIYSVGRRHLNDILLSSAEKLPNVKLHFNHKLINANVTEGKLQFRKRDGNNEEQVEVRADLLIGADGAHSALRQAILKQSRTNFSQQYIEHGYLELNIPPTKNGEHAMETNYLHIWPRNEFMLIALPNQDGSFTVTLFMPFEMFDKLNAPDESTRIQNVKNFCKSTFPDAVQLIGEDQLVKDFLKSKPSALISVECFPLHANKAVLLGDAAHAMVPFYGQGMNAGFEDVLILDDLLGSCLAANGVEASVALFTKQRSEDAVAICELAMYNYLEMRHLVNQRGYYFRRMIDLLMNKVLGNGRWMPLYNAVTFSRTPYSKCIEQRKWQDEVLRKIRNGVVVGTAGLILAAIVHFKKPLHIPAFSGRF